LIHTKFTTDSVFLVLLMSHIVLNVFLTGKQFVLLNWHSRFLGIVANVIGEK